MLKLPLDQAAGRLAELMDAAKRGEAVVIMKDHEAVQLVPVAEPAPEHRRRRQAGSAAGQIRIAPDFDAPLDDFVEYMP